MIEQVKGLYIPTHVKEVICWYVLSCRKDFPLDLQ